MFNLKLEKLDLIIIFLFNYLFVQLLDYSILLKARYDELIYESIILHNHGLIHIMSSELNKERGNFFSPIRI